MDDLAKENQEQDKDLPGWIFSEATLSEKVRPNLCITRITQIPVELANFDPKKGHERVSQTLHTDPNPLPESLEVLEQLKKILIVITARAEPVPIWVVRGSSEKLIYLAEQRIKLKDNMTVDEIDAMVTRNWSLMSPVRYIIQPYSSLVMPCLEVHSGGASVIGEDGHVRRAYRYHR